MKYKCRLWFNVARLYTPNCGCGLVRAEYLFRTHLPPPQTLETNHHRYRTIFEINIFVFFFEKNVTFLNLPDYIMFYQNCS